MPRFSTLMIAAILMACGTGGGQISPGGQETSAQSWWRWHADKQATDSAVSRAIGESGGGNYAEAVRLTRASDRPEDVKMKEVGMLVIRSFDNPHARRPSETLEGGLRMIEDAVTMGGEIQHTGPQQLRIIFERGLGSSPNNIPSNARVADCWRVEENKERSDDPVRCIALRRRLLPRVGV